MPETNLNHLTVENLSITYGQSPEPAVDKLSFRVSGGTTFGILGGNGAGKTSTLKALAGVMPLSSGHIYLNERDLALPREADLARAHIGYCADIGGIIKQATVMEHIDLVKALRPDFGFADDYVESLIDRMGLGDKKHVPAGGFSHGMARRLSVLLAFLSASELLILDEPFDGVDPLGVEATLGLIADAKERGLVIIISTHLLSLLTQATDEIIVMNFGHVLYQSSSEEFKEVAGANLYKTLLEQDSPYAHNS
jgi:ABC-2 type transport system ATP-binding protein